MQEGGDGMTDFLDPAPPLPPRPPGGLSTGSRPDHRRQSGPRQGAPAAADGRAAAQAGPYQDRDLPFQLPQRIRAAIDARRDHWTPVDSGALVMMAVQALVVFVQTAGGSLYLDDLRAQAYALNQPLWSFIIGSNGTHFAPLPRLLDWIQSRAFPLEHGPAVVITLIVRSLLALAFWRLLRRLFGPSRLTLVPLGLLMITPALLPATLYYRQSITVVACTVAMVWAVDAHLRYLLTARSSALAVVALATAIGLGCYEKAAAIPVILLGASVAVFGRRPGGVHGAGERHLVRNSGLGVLVSGLVVAGFLVVYRSGPYDQGAGSAPSLPTILHLAWDVSARDVIPLLLGGPYQWFFGDPYAGVPRLSPGAIVSVVVIAGLAVVVTGLRRPSPLLRGAILLLAWTLPSVAIVAAGRFGSLGLLLADATRLWADLVPAFLLAGALAVLPWQVGTCRSGTGGPG